MKIAVQIMINQPIEVVFDQIADARNEATWNTTLTDYRLVSQGPIGKGSTFAYKNRGSDYRSILAEYERPESLTFKVTGKSMDIEAHVSFTTQSPGVTVVDAEYNLMPKGSMRLLLPIFSPFLRKGFVEEFENFKRFSESQK